MGGPVERAEKGAGRDGRIAVTQFAAPDAGGDEGPDAVLVAIALGDDERPQAGGERVDLEVCRGSFDAVDQAADVGRRERVEAPAEPIATAPRLGQGEQQPIERAVLAEEQNLVLAAEVVVQVARREIGGAGDVAHAGGGEAAGAEDARGGAQDVEAARIGPAEGARRPARRLG